MSSAVDLRREYEAALARHGYLRDPAQWHAIGRLDALARRLRASNAGAPPVARWLARFGLRRARAPAERGLYLWGGVGRGKTFVMDIFHAHVGVPARREHFHRFMRDVHARLAALRDTADPLERIAADMGREVRALCLDELFVTDIADAMLLAGLFTGLVGHGVTLVFTSNAAPHELYRDGLQRQRFLPAIALLEEHCEVLHLDGGQDYRLRQLERAPLYLDALAEDAEASLVQRYAELADEPPGAPGTLIVEDRPIPYRAATSEVVWFDFEALCTGPRSQSDYVEIARDYHTVLVGRIPVLGAAQEDPARRFIALVDEFYDRGVKLVVSAAAAPAGLYTGDKLRFEFERTRSRLAEMQTHEYLARPHKP